jgi:hypothetical protein
MKVLPIVVTIKCLSSQDSKAVVVEVAATEVNKLPLALDSKYSDSFSLLFHQCLLTLFLQTLCKITLVITPKL